MNGKWASSLAPSVGSLAVRPVPLANSSAHRNTVAIGTSLPRFPNYRMRTTRIDSRVTLLHTASVAPRSGPHSRRSRLSPLPTASKLVFHRYGSQYFLAQIWTAGYEQGKELPKSSRESEVAQDYPVQNVVLAATLR